jgi:hypothetical protein
MWVPLLGSSLDQERGILFSTKETLRFLEAQVQFSDFQSAILQSAQGVGTGSLPCQSQSKFYVSFLSVRTTEVDYDILCPTKPYIYVKCRVYTRC